MKNIFLTPVSTRPQKLIVLFVALLFIFMKKQYPLDWELNTVGFWSTFPNTYQNPNFVYPPWGLILMLPYKWMQAEGAKFFSVLVIGALVVRNKGSLSTFFAIVLSPYFIGTMGKCAMDILVLVFPIYLWEVSCGRRWQTPARGLAISLTLIKPQAALFIWLYTFWKERHNWKSLLWPLGIVALITIPISLVGSPPLLLQWIENLRNPSPDNLYYWSINNFSLTSKYTLFGSIGILLIVGAGLYFLSRRKVITWTEDLTKTSLLYASMAVSPYTSQQSLSSSLAFIPSWFLVFIQVIQYYLIINVSTYRTYLPLEILVMVLLAVLYYGVKTRKRVQRTNEDDTNDNLLN